MTTQLGGGVQSKLGIKWIPFYSWSFIKSFDFLNFKYVNYFQ
jgi:hypothetical protein